jgi:cytochrome d ubiquinol oxidase subunit II
MKQQWIHRLREGTNDLADGLGSLLAGAFHYLGLFAIGATVAWSAVTAFLGMAAQGHASIDDILLPFIYLELGAMVGIYFKTNLMPVRILGPVLLASLAIATIWLIVGIDRPEITQMPATDAPSNPLNKTVEAVGAGWIQHFLSHPWMLVAPALAFGGLFIAWLLVRGPGAAGAFLFSSIGMAGTLLSVGFGLYPFLLIASTDPRSSLTIWDASSSHTTLLWAFWITVVFLPIVLLYTRWVYKVIWGSVTEAKVLQDQHTLY